MNDKVRTINIEGIEIQTSLTPVELASLPQKYAELQSNWNSLREWLEKEIEERECSIDIFWHEACDNVLDKMNELEGVDNEI